jgi:hypothetical protein
MCHVQRQGFSTNPVVCFHVGADNGDKSSGVDGFLQVELPLVMGVFIILDLF